MNKHSKFPVVNHRLTELDFFPLPARAIKKIDEIFAAARHQSEADLAKKLFTEKSLPRLVAEAMSSPARSDGAPTLPLTNDGSDVGGGVS